MEPLTRPDCDLRDFAFMPLDVLRLRDSGLAARATGDEFRAAVLLWCASWHQVPAASLPDDDVDLANLCGYGRAPKEWARVREGALRGWLHCSDGRLYHPTVAEKAREAWRSKLEQRWKTECARLKKHCQRHEIPFAPPDFEDWIAAGCPQGQRLTVPGTTPDCPEGQGGNVPGTRADCPSTVPRETPSKRQGEGQGHGQGQGQGQFLKERDPEAHAGDLAGARAQDAPPSTPSGDACKAMRAAGLAETNPSHPKLLALLQGGITAEELADAARIAVASGKGFAYALATAEGRRRDAAKVTPLPQRAAATGRHHGISQTDFREGVSDDGRF